MATTPVESSFLSGLSQVTQVNLSATSSTSSSSTLLQLCAEDLITLRTNSAESRAKLRAHNNSDVPADAEKLSAHEAIGKRLQAVYDQDQVYVLEAEASYLRLSASATSAVAASIEQSKVPVASPPAMPPFSKALSKYLTSLDPSKPNFPIALKECIEQIDIAHPGITTEQRLRFLQLCCKHSDQAARLRSLYLTSWDMCLRLIPVLLDTSTSRLTAVNELHNFRLFFGIPGFPAPAFLL